MSIPGKSFVAAMAILSCFIALPARAEMNAGAFVRGYEQAQAAEKPQFEAAALNVHIGIGWANSYLASANQEAQLFCQPANATLTGPQVIDLLRRFVQAHSEAADQPYGMIILFALREMWPCAPGQAPAKAP